MDVCNAGSYKDFGKNSAQPPKIFDVCVSHDGQYIMGAGRDGVVRLWVLDEDRLVASLGGHTSSVKSVTVTSVRFVMHFAPHKTRWGNF